MTTQRPATQHDHGRGRSRAARGRLVLWVLVGVACSIGVGVALGRWAGSAEPEVARTATMQSDTSGAIAEVLLSIPNGSAGFFVPTQAEFVARLPADVRIRIVHGDPATRRMFEQALQAHGDTSGRVVRWEPGAADMAPWLRDAWIPGRAPSGSAVAYMHHPSHYEYMRGPAGPCDLPGLAGRLFGGAIHPTIVRGEGGSVVADDERVFVARRIIEAGVHRNEAQSEEAMLDHLAGLWGRRVVALSTGLAEWSAHTDLLVMPIGGRRVLLGNPEQARELLARAPEAEKQAFQVRIRRLAARTPPGHRARSVHEWPVVEKLVAESTVPSRRAGFARLRAELVDAGYDVIDIPFLSLDPERVRGRLTLSYTNVVLDVRGGVRTAYVPVYGLPALDDAAVRTWKQAGYRVVVVDTLSPALFGGALRCLCQVTRR